MIRDAQFGAKPTCVQQNDLYTLTDGSKNMGMVKTFACSSGVVFRQLPKIKECIFRRLFVWELYAAIVEPHVVIVPYGHVRHAGAQGGEAGLLSLGCVGDF